MSVPSCQSKIDKSTAVRTIQLFCCPLIGQTICITTNNGHLVTYAFKHHVCKNLSCDSVWISGCIMVNMIYAHSCHLRSGPLNFFQICLLGSIKIACWRCCVFSSGNSFSPGNLKNAKQNFSARTIPNVLFPLKPQHRKRIRKYINTAYRVSFINHVLIYNIIF